MKTLSYLLILLFPIALIVFGEVLAKFALTHVESQRIKVFLYGSIGLSLSALIFMSNAYALKSLNKEPMLVGGISSFFWGAVIGVAVSFIAGIGFGVLNGHSLNMSNLFLGFDMKLIGNIYPAATEELYFRGGVVHFFTQTFGLPTGLISGSIPFGIIHIIGSFFGKTVTLSQILGITLAGLMLSLLYLRFGLLGAFSCHLMWNAITPGWAKAFNIEDKNFVSSLEGSWITCAILLVVSAALILSLFFQKRDLLI